MTEILSLTFTFHALDEVSKADAAHIQRAQTAYNKVIDDAGHTTAAQNNALDKLNAARRSAYIAALRPLVTGTLNIGETVKSRKSSLKASPDGATVVGQAERLARSVTFTVNGTDLRGLKGTAHIPVSDATLAATHVVTVEHCGSVIMAYLLDVDPTDDNSWENAAYLADNYASLKLSGSGARITVGDVDLTLSPEFCRGKSKRKNVRTAAQTFTWNASIRQPITTDATSAVPQLEAI